jgi:hypothetical protein
VYERRHTTVEPPSKNVFTVTWDLKPVIVTMHLAVATLTLLSLLTTVLATYLRKE